MSKSLAILGRQPALGLAELENLYGADLVHPLDGGFAMLDVEPSEINFNRLGGTIKLCKVLTRLDFTDWDKLTGYLVEHVPKHVCCIGPGKITFGISTYGIKVTPKQLERTGLSVKKAVKVTGRPFRLVPNKNSTDLNSAQVLHNKMTNAPFGMELVLVRVDQEMLLCQTTNVQDIEAYARRDQNRPMRDARVGMLPPKLAQTIVNLAVPNHWQSTEEKRRHTILDPFCGTGVLLQEALLMGYDVYGTDLEPRMVEYSKANLEWLTERWKLDKDWILETGDATNHQWQPSIDAVACETYLGRPFSSVPRPEILQEVMQETNLIHKKFLQNLAKQTQPGTTMCIAVPAWFVGGRFKHLKTLDSLEEIGYTRISFVHAKQADLVYHRENQIVARELVVLRRK